MSSEYKVDETILLPRKQFKTSIRVDDDGSFGNVFPGIDRFLDDVAGKHSYLDMESIFNQSILQSKQCIQACKKILRGKQTPLSNVQWCWYSLLEIKEKTSELNCTKFAKYIKQLESGILKFLKEVHLWNDVVEVVLLIIKYWIWKTGNRNRLYKPHSAIIWFASLSWRIIAQLIHEVVQSSLIERYNNNHFLSGTGFNTITKLIRTVYVFTNTWLECSGLKSDYLAGNDHYFFITLCNHTDFESHQFYIIYHYLKHGLIQYNEESTKKKLLSMCSNDPKIVYFYDFMIQAFYSQIQGGNIIYGKNFENINDGEDFYESKIYYFEGVDTNDPGEYDIIPEKKESKESSEEKWFDACNEKEYFTRVLAQKMDNVLKHKVKKRSVISNIPFRAYSWYNQIKHLEFVSIAEMNVIFWQILPIPLQQVYQLLLNVKGGKHMFQMDRGLSTLAAGISNEYFCKLIIWLQNVNVKGCDADYFYPIHIILHTVCKNLFYRSKNRDLQANDKISQYPFDWHGLLMPVFRNWEYFISEDGDYSFPCGLYRLLRLLYGNGGPYEQLNSQIYNQDTFESQFKSIFMNHSNYDRFKRRQRKWFKKNNAPTLMHSFSTRCLDSNLVLYQHERKKTIFELASAACKADLDNQNARNCTNKNNMDTKPQITNNNQSNVQGSTNKQYNNNNNNNKYNNNKHNNSKQHDFSLNVNASTTPPMPSPIAPPLLSPPYGHHTVGHSISFRHNFAPPPRPPRAPQGPPRAQPKLTSATLAQHNTLNEPISHDIKYVPSTIGTDSESNFTMVGATPPSAVGAPKKNMYHQKQDNKTTTTTRKFMSNLGMDDEKARDLLVIKNDIVNDDLLSVWPESEDSLNTQWHLPSKPQISRGKPQISHVITQDAANGVQNRMVSVENGYSDWQGIHSSQQDLVNIGSDVSNTHYLDQSKYDVNYYHFINNDTMFLYHQPAFTPQGIYDKNRSICSRQQWISVLDDQYHHISEAGCHFNLNQYLSYLVNCNREIITVQSGLLKPNQPVFEQFRQQISNVEDVVLQHFCDLKYQVSSSSYLRELKNELIWVSNVPLYAINEYYQSNGLSKSTLASMSKIENIFIRSMSAKHDFLSELSTQAVYVTEMTKQYIALYNALNKSLKQHYQVHTYSTLRDVPGLNGSGYSMLVDLEMLDTLGSKLMIRQLQQYNKAVSQIIPCHVKLLDPNRYDDPKLIFQWQHEISTIVHRLQRMHIEITLLIFSEASIRKYYKPPDNKSLWFALNDPKYVKVKKWLMQVEQTFDEDGIPTSEGANKFLSKLGFIPVVSSDSYKGICLNFEYQWYLWELMRFGTYESKKKSIHKLPQLISFCQSIVGVTTNMIKNMQRDIGYTNKQIL